MPRTLKLTAIFAGTVFLLVTCALIAVYMLELLQRAAGSEVPLLRVVFMSGTAFLLPFIGAGIGYSLRRDSGQRLAPPMQGAVVFIALSCLVLTFTSLNFVALIAWSISVSAVIAFFWPQTVVNADGC